MDRAEMVFNCVDSVEGHDSGAADDDVEEESEDDGNIMSANTKVAMTLSNSIIGVSILAMPFCMKQCGIVLGTLMLVLSSLLTRFTCHLLLKSAAISRRKTFEFVAYHTFGSLGKLAAEINIIGFMLGILISFFVVIGDLGPEIISKAFNVENTETLRTALLLILGFAVALPLSMLKEVDTLAQLSALSILFYVVLGLKALMEAIPVLGSSGWTDKIELWNPAGILQSLPIFALALSCQTQIFEVYEALPNPSLKQMNMVVKMAVFLCTTVYLTVGIFGYIANYNKEFTGNILLSFTPGFSTDVIKFMFVLSVAMGFPLVVLPCRASVHSLLLKKSGNPFDVGSSFIPDTRFKLITLAIVSSTLGLGILCPNIELVLGFLGSTIGVLTCIIFPALMFTRLTSKYTFEKWGSQFVLVLGLVLLASCTYVNLTGKSDRATAVAFVDDPILQRRNDADLLLANAAPDHVQEATLAKIKENGQLLLKVTTKVYPKSTNPPPPEVKPVKIVEDHKEDEANPKIDKVNNDQKRQEPPVPQEPEEVDGNKEKIVKVGDDNKKDNEINAEALKKEDTELENKVHADELAAAAANEKKSRMEKAAMEKQEIILRQLEESQKQQNKLIEQQKQILDELKAHKKTHDHDADDSPENNVAAADKPKVLGDAVPAKLVPDVAVKPVAEVVISAKDQSAEHHQENKPPIKKETPVVTVAVKSIDKPVDEAAPVENPPPPPPPPNHPAPDVPAVATVVVSKEPPVRQPLPDAVPKHLSDQVLVGANTVQNIVKPPSKIVEPPFKIVETPPKIVKSSPKIVELPFSNEEHLPQTVKTPSKIAELPPKIVATPKDVLSKQENGVVGALVNPVSGKSLVAPADSLPSDIGKRETGVIISGAAPATSTSRRSTEQIVTRGKVPPEVPVVLNVAVAPDPLDQLPRLVSTRAVGLKVLPGVGDDVVARYVERSADRQQLVPSSSNVPPEVAKSGGDRVARTTVASPVAVVLTKVTSKRSVDQDPALRKR